MGVGVVEQARISISRRAVVDWEVRGMGPSSDEHYATSLRPRQSGSEKEILRILDGRGRIAVLCECTCKYVNGWGQHQNLDTVI